MIPDWETPVPQVVIDALIASVSQPQRKEAERQMIAIAYAPMGPDYNPKMAALTALQGDVALCVRRAVFYYYRHTPWNDNVNIREEMERQRRLAANVMLSEMLVEGKP
jgi:hypothetical protein